MIGQEMIYSYPPNGESGSKGVIAYLEIDNRRCTATPGHECFPTATEVYNL